MDSKRLIVDLGIIIISVVVALYCAYSWFTHGMPIYGNTHLPGILNQISIWLSGVIIALAIGALAYLDFYIYKKK